MSRQSIVPSAVAWSILTGSAALGVPLVGSGPHLPIPSPNPGVPQYASPAIAGGSGNYTGAWSSPALAAWQGSFIMTGVNLYQPGNSHVGSSLLDFTTLPLGYLPAGTFLFFGDYDGGSAQQEFVHITAFDSSGPITNPWAFEPIGVWGTGRGPAGAVDILDMPAWDFTGSTYTVDGASVTGFNPAVGLALITLDNITRMEVYNNSGFARFTIQAPLPTPGTLAVIAVGGLIASRRRR